MKSKKTLSAIQPLEIIPVDRKRQAIIQAAVEFTKANLPDAKIEISDDAHGVTLEVEIQFFNRISVGRFGHSLTPSYSIDLTSNIEEQIVAIQEDLGKLQKLTRMLDKAREGVGVFEATLTGNRDPEGLIVEPAPRARVAPKVQTLIESAKRDLHKKGLN